MMKTAADLDGFVRSGQYNPAKADSVEMMRHLQDELFDAADHYARSKVFYRTKSTSRGIERKNNTLLLMDITAKVTIQNDRVVGYEVVNEAAVKGFLPDDASPHIAQTPETRPRRTMI